MSDIPASASSTLDPRARARQPLVFGGLPEADGWALAPITPRDRVHFRVDRDLPSDAPGQPARTLAAGGTTLTFDEAKKQARLRVDDGGTLDQYLRAYDMKNGKQLWEGRLPAGAQTTPMTYTGKDGKQYVLVMAGGHGSLGTKQGDYVIAYKLSE